MKLSQHCKLAVLQYKIKSFLKITQPLCFSDFTRKIRGNSSFQFSRKIGNGCLPKPMRSPHLTIPFAYIHILKIHKQNIPGEFLALPEVKERCPYFSIIYSCCYLVSHVQLFCNPMECSLPGSSFHGISQARILE